MDQDLRGRRGLRGLSINRLIPNVLTLAALCSGLTAIRFGLQLPILLILLLSTFERFYVRFYEPAMRLGAPLFGFGTILMASYTAPGNHALVGARLLLVCFFIYFMSGLRVVHALTTNVIILCALVLAGIMGLLPTPVAIYLAFALACANVIGLAGAYALEYANRTSFLERRLLLEVAELDGLTRLLNRQAFETRVRDLWRRATTAGLNVSVLMIDVDHFKLYNDHYGHQAGDDCLRRVASTVRTAVCSRMDDCVARYGGEEIIALVIGREASDIRDVAQHIVAEVSNLQIAHDGSSASHHVSVSVGAATLFPPFGSSYDSIVRLADGALYAAKRQGRNRSVVVEARASAAA